MSIKINILTDFNGKALDRAKQEFKALETTGQKAGFILKKAMLPAIASLGALAAGAKVAISAGEAINSANARVLQINKSMGLFGDETEAVTKRLTDLAEAEGRELGISNLTIKATQAKLLTFKNLAKSANVVGGAFDRANKAALDMAAAGFGESTQNAVQLGKALEDPIKGITALSRSGITFTQQEKDKIRTLVESNNVLAAQDMILQAIEKQVGGTAAATADDTDKMREGFAQFTQSIGMALLPVLEAVTPMLLGLANWARENPQLFMVMAGALGAIAASIVAINIAMAMNPITAIAAGVIAVGAALVLAYQRFEGFRNIVNAVFNGLKTGVRLAIDNFTMLLNVWKNVFNGLARLWNNSLGKLSISIPDIPGLPGRGKSFGIPNIPYLADGGIVTGPTLAVVGEAGPEVVIPLDRLGSMGAGGGNNVTINVQGGDPNAVVDALRRYMVQNGPIPITVQ
jgi:hypothetical protein